MLDGEPDSQNHKQLRDGWMDEIALEAIGCTCKTLITLTPQLRINYALKVLQQTGQPILDILVRKVYNAYIHAGLLHLRMQPTESIFMPKMETVPSTPLVSYSLKENRGRQ
jgi:hypothetical protein